MTPPPTPLRDRYLAMRSLDSQAAQRFYAEHRAAIALEAAAVCDTSRAAELAAYRASVTPRPTT